MIPPWLFYAFFSWMLYGALTEAPSPPPTAPAVQESAP